MWTTVMPWKNLFLVTLHLSYIFNDASKQWDIKTAGQRKTIEMNKNNAYNKAFTVFHHLSLVTAW